MPNALRTGSSTIVDDILTDLFHGCALEAFIHEALQTGSPPDCNSTKWRAYTLYESRLTTHCVSDQS